MPHSFLDSTLSMFRLAPLLISKEALAEFLVRFDYHIKSSTQPPEYSKIVSEKIKALQDQDETISITSDYTDRSIPESIAVHYISGFLSYEKCWWYSSTKQLIEDVEAAETNEKIIGHAFLINSPGGESYCLEKAHEIISNLKKPSRTICERTMCSAGLYLGCASDKVYCLNKFDIVGSIGTMISYWDFRKALEKMGYVLVEAYASLSTHKNKVSDDLTAGQPEDFIKRFLDPLQADFDAAVKRSRPRAAKADEDAHIFNGEIFYAQEALGLGLIDGIKDIQEIFQELYEQGKIQNKIYSL